MTGRATTVLIVGAGASGLACAESLQRVGIDFVLLEVRDRVGGRMRTDSELLPGTPVELGALMVHGRHVPTHAWAREAGVEVRPFPNTRRARLVVDGKARSFRSLLLPLPGPVGWPALVQGLYSVPRELARYDGPEETLADFLASRPMRAGARLLVELLHAHTWAADPDELGVIAARDSAEPSHEPFGFRNFQLTSGYSDLAARKAAGLGLQIRLNHAVQAIRWGGDSVVVEGLDSVTNAPFTLSSRRLVVTVPLGVLRAGVPAFDPVLPLAKRQAIDRLGFGRAVSTALRFHGGNLTDRLGRFIVLWAGGTSSFLRPRFERGEADDVLVAFATGREAGRRALLSDQALVQETMAELAEAVPAGIDLGELRGYRVARWASDPWTRGAYSFPAPGSSPKDRRALAEPLDGRVFFAGEATHYLGECATVHGAIETGWRAAAEVLRSLGRGSPPTAG